MGNKVYICIECGYEWENGMFPESINCCPICGCGDIDEIVDIQEWDEETDEGKKEE